MSRLSERLSDIGGQYSYITITSDNCVMIEGCRQILECSEVLARVSTRQFIVEVWGKDLKMNCFNNSSVSVIGTVSSVGLERIKAGDKE